jgi:hypothetical protein
MHFSSVQAHVHSKKSLKSTCSETPFLIVSRDNIDCGPHHVDVPIDPTRHYIPIFLN